MAVLDGNGLLGVVRQVYPGYAKVTSIIDDRFSVSVIAARTNDLGIVKGDGMLTQQGLVRMDYISADARLTEGDLLVTSPLSALFPPGIPVGTVVSVHPAPNGVEQYAIVRPAANTAHIESVLVVNRLFGPEDAVNDEQVFLED
jgi:rod shape-determining protein MreC